MSELVIVGPRGYLSRRHRREWTFIHSDRGVWKREAAALRAFEDVEEGTIFGDGEAAEEFVRAARLAYETPIKRAIALRNAAASAWAMLQLFDVRGVDSEEAEVNGKKVTITRAAMQAELDSAWAAMKAAKENEPDVARYL